MFPGDVVIIEWLAQWYALGIGMKLLWKPLFQSKESEVGYAKHLTDGK